MDDLLFALDPFAGVFDADAPRVRCRVRRTQLRHSPLQIFNRLCGFQGTSFKVTWRTERDFLYNEKLNTVALTKFAFLLDKSHFADFFIVHVCCDDMAYSLLIVIVLAIFRKDYQNRTRFEHSTVWKEVYAKRFLSFSNARMVSS